MVISWVYDFVCLSVCPQSKQKLTWTINTKVGIDSVAWHALTMRSKDQRSRSQGYQARCRRGYARPYDCLCDCFVEKVGNVRHSLCHVPRNGLPRRVVSYYSLKLKFHGPTRTQTPTPTPTRTSSPTSACPACAEVGFKPSTRWLAAITFCQAYG